MDPDLRLALEAADLADAVTAPRFRARGLAVEIKADRTPVTEADRAAEQALRHHLEAARPSYAILGEEYGGDPGDRPHWVLDPIDGTLNYLRGVPVWATLIALRVEGRVTVGVVSAPLLGRRWWAARGAGAFLNGEPIRVSGVDSLGDALLSYNSQKACEQIGRGDQALALARRCGRVRGFGDFWSHVLVAEGAVDVGLEPDAAIWDLAALQVIVEEAGGRLTDFAGHARPDGGNAITSNGRLHDEVLAIMAGHRPESGGVPGPQ